MSFLGPRRLSLLAQPPPALQLLSLLSDIERTQYHTFPTFSTGYKTVRLPWSLRRRLSSTWSRLRHKSEAEDTSKLYFGAPNGINMLPLTQHDPQLLHDLEEYIRKELEAWTGMRNLRHSASYGIREYKDGAIMKSHVDRFQTHILSAIIHVGSDKLRAPWPLQVQNRDMPESRDLVFTPDVDVILYESASLAHGREEPLQGESFANLFIHFAPDDWDQQLRRMGLAPDPKSNDG